MKAVYKILINQDNVTIKHFYHIICDPDLDEGFCAMQRIPRACTGCVEQLSKSWYPNLDKTLQPRHVIEQENCNCSYILRGYNKWYWKTYLKKETTNPDNIKIRHELDLNGITQVAAENIQYNTIGAFQTSNSNMPGYYIVQ